jgi:hypothetical protein
VITFNWRKSSYSSDQGNCVEVAENVPGMVAVRDSKDPGGPVLRFTASEWKQLTTSLQSGRPNL